MFWVVMNGEMLVVEVILDMLSYWGHPLYAVLLRSSVICCLIEVIHYMLSYWGHPLYAVLLRSSFICCLIEVILYMLSYWGHLGLCWPIWASLLLPSLSFSSYMDIYRGLSPNWKVPQGWTQRLQAINQWHHLCQSRIESSTEKEKQIIINTLI